MVAQTPLSCPIRKNSFELRRQTSIYPRQYLLQVCKEPLPPALGALVGLLLIRPEARLLGPNLFSEDRRVYSYLASALNQLPS
jgi:hypothetical protein